MVMVRKDNRLYDQMRPIVLLPNKYGYAVSSIFVQIGNTKLLCAVTMHAGVPAFLRGKGMGWLSAEYNLLPTATMVRTSRTASNGLCNGRSVEISRIIGRSLRSVIDFSGIPDTTIIVDCDILQADGSTRTAAISAGYLVLCMAQTVWLEKKIVKKPFLKNQLAAVSVGVFGRDCLLDPTYEEDSAADSDMNFILNRTGDIIEIQGGSEKNTVSWEIFDKASSMAKNGVAHWFSVFDTFFNTYPMLVFVPEFAEAPPNKSTAEHTMPTNIL